MFKEDPEISTSIAVKEIWHVGDDGCIVWHKLPPDVSSVQERIFLIGSNRCFVQHKLYEIYFKPDNISYENLRLEIRN
jgi:hypothetical protein